MIIGISQYADPKYDLLYARSDAEAMGKLLREEFNFDEVVSLYDGEATRDNIIRCLEKRFADCGDDEGIIIFFAGHGDSIRSSYGDDKYYLISHDGHPQKPNKNISLTVLRDEHLQMWAAKHVLLILDSCYSGLAARDITVNAPVKIDDSVLGELTRRDRKMRQLLAAGSREQKVLDGGLFGHSVFTGRLIEALREHDGYVDVDAIAAIVRKRVIQDALDRGTRQTPVFDTLRGQGGSFVFVRNKAKGGRTEQDNDTGEVLKPLTVDIRGLEISEGVRDISLDLTDTDFQLGETHIKLEVGIGNINVAMPRMIPVCASCKSACGDIDVFGLRKEGFGAEIEHADDRYSDASTKIRFLARIGLGDVKLSR